MKSARNVIARVAVATVVLAVSCGTKSGQTETAKPQPTASRVQRPGLERKDPLPQLARDLLRKNMIQHGDTMESLLWSALMLEHEMTEVVVERILRQPRMSRPARDSADTLNDWLPAKFYDLQDLMYGAAEELRLAASRGDDFGTAQAYGALARTCVTCHALYLSLPSATPK